MVLNRFELISEDKFDQLIAEARSWKMTGWDFSRLKGRWIEEQEPWDFPQIVKEHLQSAKSLVDLGTGGGEFLSSLSPLSKNTICTEGYRPNLKIARDRLKPLGIEVVCSFCDDNNVPNQRGALCFREQSLDLIIDRHESFIAKEVHGALKSKGLFLTQQVGTGNLAEIDELLGGIEQPGIAWDLNECKRQIQDAGLEILES